MKKIKAFTIRILKRRKNRHVARLPEEEDDRSVITHTIVKLPSPHLHLDSQESNSAVLILDSPIVDGDSDSPSFGPCLEHANDADITTGPGAATQLSCEESVR